jgi:iron complex transport system substrate-binding protein
LGAINLGSKLLINQSGDVALETLIRSKPDVYLMTGTQRVRNGVGAIPLGYRVLSTDVEDALTRLIDRPGFRRTRAAPESCTYALYHQFYNSVFNVIGLEYLATLIWPEAFSDIDPDQRYRDWITTFTDLPPAPFVFSARSCNGIAS